MLKIYKHPLAEEDLINIWIYGHEQWGVVQADGYAEALESQFKMLAGSPGICRERTEFIPPVRIHKHVSHLIVYLIEDDRLVIVRVLHYRMDIKQRL